MGPNRLDEIFGAAKAAMPPEPALVHDPLTAQQLANQTGLQLALQLALRIWDPASGADTFPDALSRALEMLVALEADYPAQLQAAVLRFKAQQERDRKAEQEAGADV